MKMSVVKKNAKLHKRDVARRIALGKNVAKVALKKKPASRYVRGKTSLTSGKPSTQKDMVRMGRPAAREAPGPSYIPDGDRVTSVRHLATLAKAKRIAVLKLARLPPVTVARIFVDIGILPDLSGTCRACGVGSVDLQSRPGRGNSDLVAGYEIPPLDNPLWRCDNWECQKRFNLDPDGPLKDLFTKGSLNPALTLLSIAQVLSTHVTSYASSYEIAVQGGVSKQAAERISRVVRDICARVAQAEQNDFKWKPGSLIEADEASMRVSRVPCPMGCSEKSCGDHPLGRYRLLHRRFMCACPRGRRDLSMFFELPGRTCEAGASGCQLSAEECDDIMSWVLVPGNFVLLTDGARAYQSVAPLSRCAHRTSGVDPKGFSEVRHNEHYKHLRCSHGIVSHDDEQWAVQDSVRVVMPSGATKVIRIKKGTQIVDGLWPEMRASIPDSVHTSDWDRCRVYIWAWVWSMRRAGKDALVEFGKSVTGLRNAS